MDYENGVDLELMEHCSYNIGSMSYDGKKLYTARDVDPILNALDEWVSKKELLAKLFMQK